MAEMGLEGAVDQAQLSAAERDLAANSDDAAELEMLIESLQKELLSLIHI